MVNSILNAVTKQLGTTFGNGYHYYVEDVEQGLTEPCFTVDLLIPSSFAILSSEYFITNSPYSTSLAQINRVCQ